MTHTLFRLMKCGPTEDSLTKVRVYWTPLNYNFHLLSGTPGVVPIGPCMGLCGQVERITAFRYCIRDSACINIGLTARDLRTIFIIEQLLDLFGATSMTGPLAPNCGTIRYREPRHTRSAELAVDLPTPRFHLYKSSPTIVRQPVYHRRGRTPIVRLFVRGE